MIFAIEREGPHVPSISWYCYGDAIVAAGLVFQNPKTSPHPKWDDLGLLTMCRLYSSCISTGQVDGSLV